MPKVKTEQGPTLFAPDVVRGPSSLATLIPLGKKARNCEACALHKSRKAVVFGAGNPDSPPIAFVGESPGAEDELRGEPFVGPAGELLTRMIAAMGYDRSQVYICTAVLCRPPGGRPPSEDERETCSNFLDAQLLAVKPKVIVALGQTAAKALLKTDLSIGQLRHKWHEWKKIPLRVTYHPAYLLREAGAKALSWEDMLHVQRLLLKPTVG